MLRRLRVKWPGRVFPEIKEPDLVLDRVVLELMDRYGEQPKVLVAVGDRVQMGQPVAESIHLLTHASMDGVVSCSDNSKVVIERSESTMSDGTESRKLLPQILDAVESLKNIGLVGMGGSMFPSMRKAQVARNVHTLVVNGVECEPGVTIDQAILLEQSKLVISGARRMASLLGAKNIVLAVKRERWLIAALKDLYEFPLIKYSASYPAGAEKLIVAKLAHRMPATGEFPANMGYQIHNVATLRALGLAQRDGVPVLNRPLSVSLPARNIFHNLIVPVGAVIGDLMDKLNISIDIDKDIIVSGGMMMGRVAVLSDVVTKGTTSLVILQQKSLDWKETACIRCGACNVACPLGLHPIGMVRRLEKDAVVAPSTRIQLDTCFLCGACEAVCPAHIPLLKRLKEGK